MTNDKRYAHLHTPARVTLTLGNVSVPRHLAAAVDQALAFLQARAAAEAGRAESTKSRVVVRAILAHATMLGWPGAGDDSTETEA